MVKTVDREGKVRRGDPPFQHGTADKTIAKQIAEFDKKALKQLDKKGG